MATFTTPYPCGAPARRRAATGFLEAALELATASLSTARCSTSPSCPTRSATSRRGAAGPGHRHQVDLAGHAEVAQGLAGPGLGQDALDQDEMARGVGPFADHRFGQQPVHHLVDGPRHGGHGGDAEALVDLGPPGVVDPGHHVGDAVVLPGDPGRQDVRVVSAGHRGQGARVRGPGPVEVVAVEARAHDRGSRPVGGKATEGTGHLVDDRHACGLARPAATARPEPTRPHPTMTTCTGTMQHGVGRAGQLTGCGYLMA